MGRIPSRKQLTSLSVEGMFRIAQYEKRSAVLLSRLSPTVRKKFAMQKRIPKAEARAEAPAFDAQAFLDSVGLDRKIVEYRRGESVYTQGDPATAVMYIQSGGVKLSVVNGSGKEAIVAMFGPGDFFGEGCMAGQTIWMERQQR